MLSGVEATQWSRLIRQRHKILTEVNHCGVINSINEAGGPVSAVCLAVLSARMPRFGGSEVHGRGLAHTSGLCACGGARPETSREGSLILTPSGMRETQTTNQKRAAVTRWGQWAASPATS